MTWCIIWVRDHERHTYNPQRGAQDDHVFKNYDVYIYIYMDHKRVRGHVYLSFAHGLWPHIFRGRGGILQFCPRDAPWLCPLFMHAWARD